MNALDKSVRHNKDFKYDDQDASSSMLEPYGGVGDQKGNGESKAAAASTVEAQGNGRWAAAARAAVPAKVEQTKVEEFKIKDDSSKSSSSGVGQTTMGWKLDRVMKGTGEVMNKVREIIDVLEADNVDAKIDEVKTKVDEVKAGFERQAQLFDAKIKEYKQSLENTVPTVTSQMTEVKTSFDTKMPTLEAKIDEVKQSFESKAQTLTAQMAEVKTSFDAKVSTLEAKIDKLNDHIQEMKPWQGSPTLGMRASRSEGRLDTKR